MHTVHGTVEIHGQCQLGPSPKEEESFLPRNERFQVFVTLLLVGVSQKAEFHLLLHYYYRKNTW